MNPKKDVTNTESSPVENEQEQSQVETQETETQETNEVNREESQESNDQSPSPQSGNTAVEEENDERGVPWKNRAFEYQRKFEELSESLPKIIEKQLSDSLGKQQNQPHKYSIEELEAFALEKPEFRPWAEAEKEKLREEKTFKRMEDYFNRARQTQQDEFKKQQSLNYVMQNYPDMFLKDASGKPTSWDKSHPMTQEVGRIMQDKRFAEDPQGLLVASEISYARHARGQLSKAQKEVKKVTQKVKKLENQNFTEGGGKSPVNSGDSVRKSIEQLKQTGSKKDAESAVGEYLRKSGRIK